MTSSSVLFESLPHRPTATGGVMALGNFDGVHLGHQAVVRAAAERAKTLGVPAYAMTFSPHPYSFFKKMSEPFFLTTPQTKARLLKEAGADDVVVLPFSLKIAALSAEEFIDHLLIETFHVRHITVGYDYAFGAGRTGSHPLLRAKLEPVGAGVSEVPPLCDAGGEVISSTRIRKALSEGDLPLAESMLGRPFVLEGQVIQGDKRGRTLDMPTANMSLGDYVRPKFGVYAIVARAASSDIAWRGVANIGIRPTIGDNKELLEFHLFDCKGSLYNESWEVELRHFMRPEIRFDNLEDLKAQIKEDALMAKRLLGEF